MPMLIWTMACLQVALKNYFHQIDLPSYITSSSEELELPHFFLKSLSCLILIWTIRCWCCWLQATNFSSFCSGWKSRLETETHHAILLDQFDSPALVPVNCNDNKWVSSTSSCLLAALHHLCSQRPLGAQVLFHSLLSEGFPLFSLIQGKPCCI